MMKKDQLRLNLCLLCFLFTGALLTSYQYPALTQTVINEVPVTTLDTRSIGAIYGIDWRVDGQFLAVATDTGIWIYTPALDEIAHLTVQNDIIYSVSWNVDGSKLAGGGEDSKIHIWDVSNLNDIRILSELVETGAVLDVEWNSDEVSKQIAVRIYESTQYFSDAAVVYSSIHVWDISMEQVVQTPITNKADVTAPSWNSTGDTLLIKYRETGSASTIMLWDVATNQPINEISSSIYGILSLAWRPNTKTFVTTNQGGYVSIFDENLQDIGTFPDSTGEQITATSWNPLGSALATGTDEGWIDIWNMDVEQQLIHIQGHTSTVYDLDWNPNDVYLASVTYEGELKIWDISSLPALSNLTS